MSLAITTTTSGGIVLAADSRQSYRNSKGHFRIGSDSANKIVQFNRRVGVVSTGAAFLPNEQGIQKDVPRIIQDFAASHSESEAWSPGKTARELRQYFQNSVWFKQQEKATKKQLEEKLAKDGVREIKYSTKPDLPGVVTYTGISKDGDPVSGTSSFDGIQFTVAGFDEKNDFHVFVSYLPGQLLHPRDSGEKPAVAFGANWHGQNDVVNRLILGRDHRIDNLKFVQEAIAKDGAEALRQQLSGLEYAIQWSTMNLKDGVDFARLMVEMTIAIQRFSDGILSDPGDLAGVGGHVDIAVITPDDGFQWVAKKALE